MAHDKIQLLAELDQCRLELAAWKAEAEALSDAVDHQLKFFYTDSRQQIELRLALERFEKFKET